MRNLPVATLLLVVVIFTAMRLEAQKHPNVELGFNADRMYQVDGLDSVNVFNGNLIIRIPIGSAYATDGSFGYRLTLVYNSKVWDYYRDPLDGLDYLVSEGNWRSNAGTGWRVSLGRLLSPGATSDYPSNDTHAWIYEGPSGDEHEFFDGNAQVTGTTDESYLRMTTHLNSDREIEFPNGERHTFKYERGRWRLRQIVDRFNNSLVIGSEWLIPSSSFDSREVAWTLTDSTGRQHRVNFSSFPHGSEALDRGMNVSSIVLASIGGNAEYKFTVQTAETSWGCGHWVSPERNLPDTATLPLLTRLTLPDQTSFDFIYYSSALEGGSCAQGALKSMTVPTGGTTTYQYGHYSYPESFCRASTFGERNPGVTARTTPDGRWDYLLSSSRPVPFDYPKAEYDCGVRPEIPGAPPSPQVQELYRWFRVSVLSPAVHTHDGTVSATKRIRTDNFFYTWPRTAAAPKDPWNPDPGILPAQPLTTGAPAVTDLGPVTTPGADAKFFFGASSDANLHDPTHLSTRVYECPAGLQSGDCTGGTLLRSTSLRLAAPYGGNTYDGDWGYGYRYAPKASRTVYHDDGGCGTAPADPSCWVQTTSSDEDGYGNYRKSRTTTNFPGKKGEFSVVTNYLPWVSPLPWILGLYDRTERTDSTGTAYSAYCVDRTTGLLQGVRVMKGETLGSTDLLTLYTADAKGNLKEEKNYGGDVQPLSTQGVCVPPASPQYLIRNSYVDTVVQSQRQRTVKSEYCDPTTSTASTCASVLTRLDVDVHRDSGLPLTSRDVAGVPTTYAYHSSTGGLLASVAPSGLAPTNYSYQRAAFPHSVSISTPATAGQTYSTIAFDKLGRIAKVNTLLPDEGAPRWSVVDTAYDSLGRRYAVSQPYLAGSESGSGVTTFEYDAFGRTHRVEAPDESVARYAYKGVREKTRSSFVETPSGPAEATVTERYYAQGRLVEVEENAGPGNANVKTTYAYDVGGRLTAVEMLGPEGSSSQVRTFAYDQRGFLLYEDHPESDRVYYSGYDARGHAALKTLEDPASIPRAVTAHDLRFTYDRAERLTLIEAQNPSLATESFRSLKELTFGTGNEITGASTNWRKGKLVAAMRWNYPAGTGDDDVFKITETYRYLDAAGRRTDRETSLERNSQFFREVQQTVGYNDLGLPSWIGHPTCFPCTYPGTSAVQAAYSAGRLQSLERLSANGGWFPVADLSYGENGMAKAVQHGNGMVDQIEFDTMSRPKRIEFGPWSRCDRPSGVSISVSPSQTINSGQTVTLTATGQGTAPFRYEWLADSGNGWVSVGADSATLTRTLTQTAHFRVRIANSCQSAESAPATVTVSQCTAPVIETHPVPDLNAVLGASVTLEVTATGTAPLAYAWFAVDNPAAVIGSGRILTIPSIAQTTVYACRVSNACGTVTTNAGYVRVDLPMPLNLRATRSSAQAISLTWTAAAGAHRYRVERKAQGQAFAPIGDAGGTAFSDASVVSGRTYVYRVVALDVNGGSASPASHHDLATTMIFTNVTPGLDVGDSHLHELLTALGSLHGAEGWAVPTWSSVLPSGTPAPGPGVFVDSVHLSTLRARMDAVLKALGVASGPYLDDPIRPEQTDVKAAHVVDLQQRAQ